MWKYVKKDFFGFDIQLDGSCEEKGNTNLLSYVLRQFKSGKKEDIRAALVCKKSKTAIIEVTVGECLKDPVTKSFQSKVHDNIEYFSLIKIQYTSEMRTESNQLTFTLNDQDGDKFLDTFAKAYLNGERLEAKSLNCEPVRINIRNYVKFAILFSECRKSHEGERWISGTSSLPRRC